MNLQRQLQRELCSLANKYPEVEKLVLFGSRARGDHQAHSDIDLAIYPRHQRFADYANFCADLENTATLLKFDTVVVDHELTPRLRDNIDQEGVVLMEKLPQKIANFSQAIERLREAVAEFTSTQSSAVRDGAIQRFEFTLELAWKTLRAYLIDQGYTELDSPKTVLKTALTMGLLANEKNWLQALTDRNCTSHLYSETLAAEIYQRIEKTHLAQFTKLLKKLT